MNKEQKEFIKDTLTTQKNVLAAHCWEMIKKLQGSEYKCTRDQIRDMAKLGRMADTWLSLDQAQANLYEAESHE